MISILSIFTLIGSILLFTVTAKVGTNYLKTKDIQSLRLTEFYFFSALAFLIYSFPGIVFFSPEQIITARFLTFIPLTIGFTVLNHIISKLIYSPRGFKMSIWLIGGASLILNIIGFRMFNHEYYPIKIGNFIFHLLAPVDWGQVIAASATIIIVLFSAPMILRNSVQTSGIAKKRGLFLTAGIITGALGIFFIFVLVNFIKNDNYVVMAKIIGVLFGTLASIFNFIGFVVLRKEEDGMAKL